MKDKQKALNLLDQIIEMAQQDDKILKAVAIKANKASRSVGESSTVFHLRVLRELIEEK